MDGLERQRGHARRIVRHFHWKIFERPWQGEPIGHLLDYLAAEHGATADDIDAMVDDDGSVDVIALAAMLRASECKGHSRGNTEAGDLLAILRRVKEWADIHHDSGRDAILQRGSILNEDIGKAIAKAEGRE